MSLLLSHGHITHGRMYKVLEEWYYSMLIVYILYIVFKVG